MHTEKLTIEALEQWAQFGAHWRVVEQSQAQVLVELQTCTDEPVQRHRVHDAAIIAYLRDRPRVPE